MDFEVFYFNFLNINVLHCITYICILYIIQNTGLSTIKSNRNFIVSVEQDNSTKMLGVFFFLLYFIAMLTCFYIDFYFASFYIHRGKINLLA